MRILHVIASFNPVIGGPAEAIRNIILEYKKVGIDAEIVSLDEKDATFLSSNLPAFTVHALGHVDNKWFYSPQLRTWLAANISRFDTVIMHGLWLYPSYAVSSFIRQLKADAASNPRATKPIPRLFIFPHGMLDPYFQQASQRRFKAIRNWIYWKLIEGRVVNEADALLFTCETELTLARKTFRPYRPKREINVGYGIVTPPDPTVAMTRAFLEKCPEVTGKPYFLFLSRIHYKKGVDLLVGAYAALLENNAARKDQLPRLVIAGPGMDTAYGESIQQLINRHPIVQDMVFFPGMLAGPAKWGAIYSCQAFVLPSHQENFGIAVAESLACGKPVLISNQVNIWREVLNGGGGLIEHDTLSGTQSLLEQWVGMSESLKRKMAYSARQTFEAYFRMEQVIYRLNHVFSSLG